jgi:hypothetical protein
MAIYDIDLLRQIFVDKLNDNTIFLASFYEQIEDEQSVSRYVANIKDMIALQNQEKSVSNYKAMGVISQSGQAEILNIRTNYITPLEYQVRFDIQLSDRDYVLDKIKTLIDTLRGNKYDMVALTNGTSKILTPNTINTTSDKPELRLGATAIPNYFTINGSYNPTSATTDWSNDVDTQYHNYANTTPFSTTGIPAIFWFVYNGKLYQRGLTLSSASPVTYTYGVATEVGTVDSIYKVSLSFNGVQSDEPFINNGLDRVLLFFGGSATIVKNNVALGNDIVKTTIQVGKDTGTIYDVEPLEIPSSLSLNDDSYQLYANGYQSIDRNLAVQNKLNYSFVYDRANALFNDLYKFSRYGSGATTYTNQIFTIKEYRYSLGTLIVDKFYAKLSESGVQNTNGDVLTLTLSFKVGAY